jgi:hypothetical protein
MVSMGALITTGGNRLPNTMIENRGEDGQVKIPKEVGDYILREFVLPVFSAFDAGRTRTTEETVVKQRIYVRACVGFTPEAYPVAAEAMAMGFGEGWLPPPAICRDWLQKAENSISARTGLPQQVRDQEELKQAMLGGICLKHGETITIDDPYAAQPWNRKRKEYVTYPTAWDRARHGPMPTEPGCRLDASTQRECWMLYFGTCSNLYVYEHRAVLSGIFQNPYEEAIIKSQAMLARARRLESLGIQTAPPTCPILHGVMVELGVPMAPDDVARIDHQEDEILHIIDERESIAAEESELLKLRQQDKYWLDASMVGEDIARENQARVDSVNARKSAVSQRVNQLIGPPSDRMAALPHYPTKTLQ